MRTVAVVVSYERRELLLQALAAVAAQTRPPDAVHVVDNASTDGSAAAVRTTFPSVSVHALTRNTGGAGGFAFGMGRALDDGADLIWLLDDDTVPRPDALAQLLRARGRYAGPPPSLLASRVVWTDGRAHPMNTPRAKPLARRPERAAADAAGCVAIRSASFVSVLVDAGACRRHGLPVADYFLWNDDFEFTTRICRDGAGLLCPASVVEHHTASFGSADHDPGPRFFYEVRNKAWLLTRSSSLGPLDRLLYGGSTLRRWLRLLVRSRARTALLRHLGRGLLAACRAPRPNDVVLAGLDPAPTPGGRA